MKSIKQAFSEYNRFNMRWPFKCNFIAYKVYFIENLHCCNGRRHDVTYSHRKLYVTCGHNIIYDMTLNNSNIIW